MITIKDVLSQGTNRLRHYSKSGTPYLDALLLMAHTLKKSKEQIIASLDEVIWEVDAIQFGNQIQQRMTGIPVAYLIKRKEFYGLEFYVDHRVLIPRPDTEILVETALHLAEEREDLTILDLCTGSGCIGISLTHELLEKPFTGDLQLTLSDISSEALSVSALNARNILGSEPPTIESDLFTKIPGSFDIIISNPPYLTDQESNKPELLARKEPDIALRSGTDGLVHMREIIKDAYKHLNPQGYLILEGGFDQAERIRELLICNGYTSVMSKKDLGGNDRVVYGMRTH